MYARLASTHFSDASVRNLAWRGPATATRASGDEAAHPTWSSWAESLA
ncbi:hypothetical protein I551_3006 [Mycobacterium ulcerans str. Harvey]|uniref:Uncharacterized protein n=1 Tax=Mycobacterium ulcerans str. Harvey TaxID=1299332 RepID=A0ABN0R0G7_MYCUL|nr:hypothetical protein I551_3006 [Mycobacterium ulcerans str. Harvey]